MYVHFISIKLKLKKNKKGCIGHCLEKRFRQRQEKQLGGYYCRGSKKQWWLVLGWSQNLYVGGTAIRLPNSDLEVEQGTPH